MADIRKINVPELGKLKAFSHATRAGGFIYVSGTLGTKAGSFELVPGGAGAETRQTLSNIQAILRFAGADLADVVKVNVFITDMAKFGEMNEAYLAFFPSDPPARITVGCSALALGAIVEIDCVAYKP
jgi:2-iminobutanoate/2-iminopropanoate deaminase